MICKTAGADCSVSEQRALSVTMTVRTQICPGGSPDEKFLSLYSLCPSPTHAPAHLPLQMFFAWSETGPEAADSLDSPLPPPHNSSFLKSTPQSPIKGGLPSSNHSLARVYGADSEPISTFLLLLTRPFHPQM